MKYHHSYSFALDLNRTGIPSYNSSCISLVSGIKQRWFFLNNVSRTNYEHVSPVISKCNLPLLSQFYMCNYSMKADFLKIDRKLYLVAVQIIILSCLFTVAHSLSFAIRVRFLQYYQLLYLLYCLDFIFTVIVKISYYHNLSNKALRDFARSRREL